MYIPPHVMLDNGADPNVPCYANLKPIDVIGQCRKCKEDQEKVRELLLRPLKGKRRGHGHL